MSGLESFVIRIPGRRMFLRWDDGGWRHTMHGSFNHPPGPVLRASVTLYASEAEAEDMLARCIAHAPASGLLKRCVVEPYIAPVGSESVH